MGFYTKLPARFVLDKMSNEAAKVIADYFTLCILNEVQKEEALANLLREHLAEPANDALLNGRVWVTWEELEPQLRKRGFSHSRSTIWRYRNEHVIPQDFVRSNKMGTLYDAIGIIGTLVGLSVAPDKMEATA